MKPAPSLKNLPENIHPDAKDVWAHIVRKYADDIYESKNLREQWEKAKRHFERLCRLREVTPYDTDRAAAARIDSLLRKL